MNNGIDPSVTTLANNQSGIVDNSIVSQILKIFVVIPVNIIGLKIFGVR